MERELQIEAFAQWLLGPGSTESCLQTLQKLETTHGLKDAKAAHNLAVVEYYCSQCKDPAALIEQLDTLAKSQSMPGKQQPPPTQPLAPTPSMLPTRSLSSSSSVAAASAAATAATAASADAQLDPCASEGEEVSRVCQLNKAILLYQRGSYKEAVELLEPAYAELEVLHDGHALHVCTLLMDCFLALHQPQRAASVLLTLEQAFAHTHPPDDASPPLLGSVDKGGSGSGGGSSNSSGSSTRPVLEALNSCSSINNLGLGTGAHLQLPIGSTDQSRSSSDFGGGAGGHAQTGSGGLQQQQQQQQQWQSCMVALPSVTRWDSDTMGQACQLLHQHGHALTVPNARLLIQLYRAELLLYQQTNAAAAHEVAPLLAQAPGSLAVILLRAHLLSAQGNPDSAAHVLLDAYQQLQQQQQQQRLSPHMLPHVHAVDADGVFGGSAFCPTLLAPNALSPKVIFEKRAAMLNNMGLLHQQAGRPQLALTLLERALHQLQHPEGQLPGVTAAAAAAGGAAVASPSCEANAGAPGAKANHSGEDSSSSSSSSRNGNNALLSSDGAPATPSTPRQASRGSNSVTAAADTNQHQQSSSTRKSSLLSSHPIAITADFASPGPSPSSLPAPAVTTAAPQHQHAQQQQQQQWDRHSSQQTRAAPVDLHLDALQQQQQRNRGGGCGVHVSNGSGYISSNSSTHSGVACSVLYNLGLQHLQLGHWEEARCCFRRAGVGVEEGVWAGWETPSGMDGGRGKGEVVVIDARMLGAQVEGAAGCGGGSGLSDCLWELLQGEPLCLLRLAEAAINSYLQQRQEGAAQSQRDGRDNESSVVGPSIEVGGRLRWPDSSNPPGTSATIPVATLQQQQQQQQHPSDAGAPAAAAAATPPKSPTTSSPSVAAAVAGAAALVGSNAELHARRLRALLEEAARALAAGLESLHVQMRIRVQQKSAAEAAATEAALQMVVQGEELVASHDRGAASTSAAGQDGMMNGAGPACAPHSLTSGAAAEAPQELRLMAKGAPSGWATDRAAQVHQALLTNLAFLHLLRDDHQQALQAAQTLLDLPDDSLSPQSLLVGRCYAAEAQVALGNATEAEGYLSAAILQMQEQPELLQTLGGCNAAPCPGMMAGAASVAVMLVNLAYVLCTEGRHEQARGFVQRALACNSSLKPAYLLLVWLELAQGRTSEALRLLQESSRSSVSGMPL